MMIRHWQFAGALLAMALTACGGAANDPAPDQVEAANSAAAAKADARDPSDALKGCPFRKTSEWIGSIERGYLRLNGRVDLMMAGFKPVLTLAEGAAGVTRADLALVPEPGAVVNDRVKLEKAGVPPNGRAEIWCGGKRIAAFDMVVVR